MSGHLISDNLLVVGKVVFYCNVLPNLARCSVLFHLFSFYVSYSSIRSNLVLSSARFQFLCVFS